jgi:hypothetical protein
VPAFCPRCILWCGPRVPRHTRIGAAALAALALALALQGDHPLAAVGDLFQGDGQGVAEVLARLVRTPLREQPREGVADGFTEVLRGGGLAIRSVERAKAIVAHPLLWIAEGLVGLHGVAKPALCVYVIRVSVWMIAHREVAKGFLDLVC